MSVAPAKVVIFQCMTTLAIAFWEVQIGLKYKKKKDTKLDRCGKTEESWKSNEGEFNQSILYKS